MLLYIYVSGFREVMLIRQFQKGVQCCLRSLWADSGDVLHTCRLFKIVLKTQKDVGL